MMAMLRYSIEILPAHSPHHVMRALPMTGV
jgi:hypothetical protein